MKPPVSRIVTPARIVALALIALSIGGLAYVRLASGSDVVSVPNGAEAGDLSLTPCTYDTEDGGYAADCGTLVVPENRADPRSRLIALPVTRIRARSGASAEPVFRLEGGPGKTNMHFANASRFAEHRDVVLVGYRGADGSERLDCPEVASTLKRSTDFLTSESFRAYGDAFRRCAARLTEEGVDLAGYNVTERVDDLEAARAALGYRRIDLLSESAGTRYALVYAWRYPARVHRSVMIAVNPPGNFLWDARTTDEQLGRYSRLCARNRSCSSHTDDLSATIRRVDRDLPDHWLFLPIRAGNVRTATFYGLVESSSELAAPISAPMTLGSWLAADEGDASGFWFLSLLSKMAFPESFIWGEMAALGSTDDGAATRYFSTPRRERGTALGNPGTDFIWGGGSLVDGWPGPAPGGYASLRPSSVPTLLIGGELDFATPPQVATDELLPHLANGKQVIIPSLGHSGSFWEEQPEAGTRLVNTYLDSGRVDRSLYEPMRVDFTPDVTQTALGKGIGGTMLGLAVVTVVSLLLMAVRKRRFGRKSSAVLRSVYAVLLGLGGWFIGVLVVITAMPDVPLDSAALATASIGLPVGLAVYWAWVDGGWKRANRMAGFAAAVGGALLGAWLGFGVTDGLLAVITTILGATAGANLAVLALDMAWDAQERDRFAAATAGEALHARPSVG